MIEVSVILPVLNGADTIEAAITSIINQTFQYWELIIVDDGSTDKTPYILQEIEKKDKRIQVIKNQGHKGIIISLNSAWKQSKSELIARMDADDKCNINRLKEQVEFMNSHPNIAVLGTGAKIVSDGNRDFDLMMPETHEQIVKKIYRVNPFIHSSVMIRKDFLQKMGGYILSTGYKNVEDYDLWVRGHKQYKYHNLQKVLIKYRGRQTITIKELYNRFLGINKILLRDKKFIIDGWYNFVWMLSAILSKIGLYKSNTFRQNT